LLKQQAENKKFDLKIQSLKQQEVDVEKSTTENESQLDQLWKKAQEIDKK
jgi:hypothetical protein